LDDKKQLVQKVEELIQQLRNVESKHQTSIHALQQRHTVEIARTKQLAAAAEKIRRERWVERQTARIKVSDYQHLYHFLISLLKSLLLVVSFIFIIFAIKCGEHCCCGFVIDMSIIDMSYLYALTMPNYDLPGADSEGPGARADSPQSAA
jgi:predicted PurR-regulated permease PerM